MENSQVFIKKYISKHREECSCNLYLQETKIPIYTFFFISMVYFLLSLSVLRKKPLSASKQAKDMLAYRKRTPYYFMQQTTALHGHGNKCCNMETFKELTCQKHMERFEGCCIFSQKYICQLNLVYSFHLFSLFCLIKGTPMQI